MNNPKIRLISPGNQIPQPQVPQNNPQARINFLQDINIDNNKASHFEDLLSKAQLEIMTNENLYNLSPIEEGDSVIYQFWKFEFPGKGNFEGKCISGVLKFQPNHPLNAPRFVFDTVKIGQQQEVLQHENIYGDNSLCIPLFTYWKPITTEFEILQAIENIFQNPNWNENDAPANPTFSGLDKQAKDKRQKEQAKFLENFIHKK